MSFLPKIEHLKFYERLAKLLVKYGRSDLVKYSGMSGPELAKEPPAGADAQQLTKDLEALGPTFIKIGQLLSTRPDLIPPPYLKALARLQDEVEGFPPKQARETIVEELGMKIEKAFSEFHDEPMAAASLGQVHFARLRDGRPVAVKVQRPGVRKEVLNELEALGEICEFMEAHTDFGREHRLAEMLEEFRASIIRELDYVHEARNLRTLKENLKEFKSIIVPSPIPAYTTSRVLTMEYVEGVKVTKLSGVQLPEADRAALVDELFAAYMKQIFVDGFFHADPHPGNLLLTPDGKLALIDLGMTGEIAPELRQTLLELVLAMSEGRGEDAAELVLKVATTTEDFNERLFRRKVADYINVYAGVTVERIEVGHIMTETSSMAATAGLFLPIELTMLGKTLLNLDHAGHSLYPGFKPGQSVQKHSSMLMRRHLHDLLSPEHLLDRLREIKDSLEAGPRKVGMVLDKLAHNELSIHVDTIDEKKLIQGIHKVANRITLGLILAALIVGAALVLHIPTKFTIFGYPGIAIIFFLVAACGALLLALNIVIKDRIGDD